MSDIIQGNFTFVPSLLREELEAVTTEDSRYYKTPVGNLPSVTTVIGHENKKFFADWRKKNKKESERTLDRGTILHEFVERYLSNEPIDKTEIPFRYVNMFNGMRKQLERVNNIVGLEFPLYSSHLGLAGRADCIAEFDNELSVIDFKFLNKTKTVKEMENYFLQTTAYVIAMEERYSIKIQKIVVIAATEERIHASFVEKPLKYVKRLKEVIDAYQKEVGILHG